MMIGWLHNSVHRDRWTVFQVYIFPSHRDVCSLYVRTIAKTETRRRSRQGGMTSLARAVPANKATCTASFQYKGSRLTDEGMTSSFRTFVLVRVRSLIIRKEFDVTKHPHPWRYNMSDSQGPPLYASSPFDHEKADAILRSPTT